MAECYGRSKLLLYFHIHSGKQNLLFAMKHVYFFYLISDFSWITVGHSFVRAMFIEVYKWGTQLFIHAEILIAIKIIINILLV